MTTYDVFKGREGHTEELALFSQPLINSAIESSEYVVVRPISTLSHSSFIEFQFNNVSPSYVCLDQSRLYIKCRILQHDGTSIGKQYFRDSKEGEEAGTKVLETPDSCKVSTASLFFHTMIRQCDISLNGILLSSYVNTNYAFKSFLDILMQNDIPDSILDTIMFHKDQYEFVRDADAILGGNKGLLSRHKRILDSKPLSMCGPLALDICTSQNKYLLNNVPMNIKIFPNSPEFCLISSNPNPNYKIEIMECALWMKMIKPKASVLIAQNRLLSENKPALYSFMRSVLKTYTIAQGSQNFSVDSPFTSFVPSELLAVLITSEAFAGSYSSNCMAFNNCYLNFAAYYVDGKPVNGKPFQTSFVEDKWSEGSFLDMFLSLFENNENTPQVDMAEFAEAYTIMRWVTEKFDKQVYPQGKRGHSNVELKFDRPLEKNMVLLLYGKFPCLMTIDFHRKITLID